MFGSILLRIGTYLVETFIGKGAVKDGGIRLENVKNAIESKINDVKKTTEIGSIKNMLVEIVEADDKTIRNEKVDAVIKQIDEVNFAQPTEVGTEAVNGFSNNLIRFISEIGVLKIVLGLFLLILLFMPYCIKRSLKDSGIVQGTRETADFAVKNLKSLKLSKDSIEFNINDPQEVANVKSKVDAVDKKLKEDIAKNLSCREENPDCFVYLGEAKADKLTWANAETIDKTITIKSLTNSKITFTNGAYLRKANTKTTCPHGVGEIVSAVIGSETATIIGEPDLCLIEGKTTYGVWAKVRKN
jgi:hypothetical protein